MNESSANVSSQVPNPTEICRLSATTLSHLIRTRQLSSVEVVSAFLDRIEAINPIFNAIVNKRDRDDILQDAREADARLARDGAEGALHGLPIAVKDLALTKGLTTTFGSPIFEKFIPNEDQYHVARIKKAGAIVIGKTNVSEFGLGSNTYNQVFGVTRNAFNPSLVAGGSSGGAAVALATNMLPIADGSDMGGSLRNPAAYNNIYGFRPSQGRVPTGPQSEAFLSQMTLDGPLGRSTADLALLLGVQAGYERSSPLSLEGALLGELDLSELAQHEIRVAWLGDLESYLPVEEEITALCERALSFVGEFGWKIDAFVPNFDFEELWRAFVVLRQSTGGATLAAHKSHREHWEMLKPEAKWEAEGALRLTALDIFNASTVRTNWYRFLSTLTETYDLIAFPTAQVFPYNVSVHWPSHILGRAMDSYHRWMEVTAYATMAGSPTISVPVGFDANGRPMGMQLIGRPRGDAAVLRAAAQYERFTSFGGGRYYNR